MAFAKSYSLFPDLLSLSILPGTLPRRRAKNAPLAGRRRPTAVFPEADSLT
ncbi:MAG TPA: hypothetical protein VFA26_22870 [Gemmataceae bacterium]|nr:hypothetical protein [Gemmataceae bacterium]